MNIYQILGRDKSLFAKDINGSLSSDLSEIVKNSSFLVVGAAGTIGRAVSREIFVRDPKLLHLVDISENNLVETVRDLRSSVGYGSGEFKTFCLDYGGEEFQQFITKAQNYDYILNLAAMKHVRSERDPFTALRMLKTNISFTVKLAKVARRMQVKNYFCVSTDKAANPVNLMGASKRAMELFLNRESASLNISLARFANVAFSDGSLLHGFSQRVAKQQPITAPRDIERYFISPQESGELCLVSCIFGANRDIFFPSPNTGLKLVNFQDVAKRYITELKYEIKEYDSEDEARSMARTDIVNGRWPCYFFDTDTAGEKPYEEFYTKNEKIDVVTYRTFGVIKNQLRFDDGILNEFAIELERMSGRSDILVSDLSAAIAKLVPDFVHYSKDKSLDERM